MDELTLFCANPEKECDVEVFRAALNVEFPDLSLESMALKYKMDDWERATFVFEVDGRVFFCLWCDGGDVQWIEWKRECRIEGKKGLVLEGWPSPGPFCPTMPEFLLPAGVELLPDSATVYDSSSYTGRIIHPWIDGMTLRIDGIDPPRYQIRQKGVTLVLSARRRFGHCSSRYRGYTLPLQ
jgi:hypothetical protein